MGQKINIPSQNQPFRKQSSLGGDVSFRNLNGTNDNSFITLAKVTKVYYKQGKLDFKLTNTVSIVQEQGGDGSGSAPIPVDFFGRKPDGQVFGHYRPVKVGDLIAIAYINGHRSNPIVIGVYPDSAPDYELISPSMFETGDDNDSGIAETGLAEQKVYPSMQTSYRSGSGTIAEALNGHSFLILDDETANQYDQLWTDYESVGFFNHNGETTNPLKEEAGSWLLVHEDNPDGDGDGHRTRFYVNPKGEIQIVLMGSDSEGDVSVLEGSRKDGFTLKHYNDLSSIKAGDKGQDVYNPDFDVAKKYVELNIGKDQSILMQAVDQGFSGGNTSLTVKSDGVYLNDKPLNASITDSVREHSKEVADAISKDLTTTKEWEDFDKRVTQAGKDAKDAGDKAKQAGEDAKQAGINAEKAGEDAKKTGEDIKRHIVYYASAFPQGDHYIPGKYLAINTETYIANGIIKSAMIEDGAIDNAKIAHEAVGSSQIEDLAVTRGKLAYMAVGTAQIEDLAVSDEKVDHLSFNHMEGELLDAHKIRVRNLEGDSISAKTLTADKLIIGELGDITDKLGTIADGKIIVKGNGSNSGVSLEGLDADNPDVYTPSKKAILANIVKAIRSSALASLDYAKQVGLSNDPVAIDLQKKYDAMVDGLAPIFNDMTATTNFDHNTVEQLTSDCNNAIDKFQNLANSQLNRKIGQTADNKNSVYQGYEQPANPHINDIWFQENSDGTYQIRVYDGGSWISPGMQDIKEVQESVSTLPRAYYSSTQPSGTDYKDGDIWYKTSTDTTNNTVVYTAYKWNRNTNTWDPLLDATSSHNYIGSAPANPIDGDFWMDNTTLKQYQNGVWKTIPTQGPQGVPGVSAKQQYTHIAYATSANGENFSSSTFSGATYIGLLVDFNEEDSSDPTKYAWSLMKGADGTDGKDGVPGKPGVDGKTSYVHFAYANSSDGKTGFNLVYFNGAKYIGIYSDFTEADSDDYTKYTWSEFRGQDGQDGTNGKDGVPGTNGKDGETSYIHTAYANSSDGKNNFNLKYFANALYIGMYTDFTEADSDDYTKYTWSRLKGNDGTDGKDGVPGAKGADGRTSYVHFAYANSSDGKNDFNLKYFANALYIGTYTDFNESDSSEPTKYTWSRLKGDKGDKGDQGIQGIQGLQGPKGDKGVQGPTGKSSYTHIAYSNSSDGTTDFTVSDSNRTYIGMYVDFNEEDSSDHTKYAWSLIKGKDGADGKDGVPGKPGADGKTPYLHIAYADSSDGKTNFSTDTPGTHKYIGSYTDFTQADSSDPALYSWQLVQGPKGDKGDQGLRGLQGPKGDKGVQGPTGADGRTSYTHIAYADTATGSGFSQYPDNKKYIGIYVDFNEEDSNDVTKYNWSLIKGADGKDGVPGKPGADGKTSYFHIAYANSSDGNTNFNLEYFANALYIGTYTDFNEEDSKDHTKYTWSRLKGDPGSNGKDGVAGKDGVGLKRTEVTYGLSGSDSTQPSRWFSQVPDLVKGQYLWSKTVWIYTDDTSETGYQKTYIAKDGNDGTDGVAGKDGVGISSTTITYAVGTSGTTAPTSGWDSQVPNVPTGQYLWTKTIWSYTDNTNETGYSVAKMGDTGPKGDPGKDGVPGTNGKDGKTYYTWIKYATDSSGSNISDSPTGMSYIGIAYNKESQTESSTPTDYTWTKIKGDDGIPGKPGADGKTSYFHIAYANSSDGKDGFYVGGGTNLLTSTDKDISVTSHTTDGWPAWANVDTGFSFEHGKTYTFSTEAKNSTNKIAEASIRVFESSTNTQVGIYAFPADGERHSVTFTIPNDSHDYHLLLYAGHAGIVPGVDVTTTYHHSKLEEGNVSTPWSPAPSEAHPLYMGTYTDYTRVGSTDPTRYTWVPMFDSTKKRNFTSQPTTPYAVGDTWTQSGATYFCTVARDSGAFRQDDWEMQQLTIHSLAPSATDSLYNDNLVSGTDQEYTMGYGIPNTVWQDGYAYLKLPTTGNGYEILPQDPHTFWYTLTAGQEYTQTIWFETDATVKDLSVAQITWFTYVGHDPQPATLINLGENKYKLYSTYMWSGKSNNNVRLFDIFYLGSAFDLSTGTYLKFGKLKLEKGSVATPWCLSQSELTTTTRDYRGVTLNDRGLTATAGSTTVAMNSNDGFLINNSSGQVFHVDTNGSLNMKGAIMSEGTISGVEFIGRDLTLNNSLQVINGKISADNGNVVINSNGLTIKDGGLKIVDGQGETTTMIEDNGTFSTKKGYFTGTITGSSIVLNGSDGSKISASGGAFSVDGFGNVTANSIKITGNRKDDVSNKALIQGANITGGNIIGNRIQSSEFMTSTREYSNGSYYPISGSIYTPSFLIEDSGNVSVHTVFPQAFSTVARIGSNKGVDGPYVNITHEAFDRSTLSGSFGYGRGYEYPVPYLYGHQGGMVEYPVNSNELSIVYMNDISRSEYNGYGLYDGYKYTEIATINDIVQKYKSKIGRIKFNFGIVCTYGSYDTSEGTTVAGGDHDLYVVLTTGRINENDTYHVDFDGKTFNNVKNNLKIKMTSKKVLTGVGGLSYYNLYAELSTKDLDLANTYYLGVLQKGFLKDSRESFANHTWKIQIDEMAIIPEGDILDDQGYYVPTAGGSYRDLAISANGSIIIHEDDIGVQTTSEYNSRYLSFAVSTDGQSPMPYWTTINADGIGFSIGNNNSSTDGSGNPNGLATRQCIYFSGDTNQNGMSMDNYGNIHAQVGAGVWRVYNNQGDEVFDVPFDPNGVFNFYVPKVNKNIDPNHKWGGLKIGWVYFDQPGYRWAETVPAIYNTGGRVKGFAMFGDFIISFVDGWCYQLAAWGRHGVPNGIDISNGEAEGTNTDAGHRGV